MMCRFGRREKSWSEGEVAAVRAVMSSFAFDLTKGNLQEDVRTELVQMPELSIKACKKCRDFDR